MIFLKKENKIMQEIEGRILIKYEPCFEDLVAVLLNNDYYYLLNILINHYY